MLRRFRTAKLLLLAALLTGGTAEARAAEVPAATIVAMSPDTTEAAQDAAAATVGAAVRRHFHGPNAGFVVDLTPSQATRVRALPGVEYVQPDVTVTAARGGGGPTTPPPAEIVPPGVRRIGGTLAGQPRRAAGVGVAVLDTGLNLTSAELNARAGTNCVSPGTTPADDNGHGTAIAGVIGARANGSATVGVAPDTALYSVKVLNRSNSGTLSQLLCGLDWAQANAARLGIRVVNMSIAAPGSDDGACGSANGDALHRAVCALTSTGVVLVAAAGNQKVDLAQTAPASYREALAVTAMSDTDGVPGAKGATPACIRGEADDRYAAYSNFAVSAAAQAHTLAAPGTCVVSTGLKGGTATYYGTSLAAPHAAAAAALCLDDAGTAGPCAGLTTDQIIARLRADALAGPSGFAGDPLSPVAGRAYGPLVSAAAY